MLDQLIVKSGTNKNINFTESNKRNNKLSTSELEKLSHCHFLTKSKLIDVSDLKMNKVAETNSNYKY